MSSNFSASIYSKTPETLTDDGVKDNNLLKLDLNSSSAYGFKLCHFSKGKMDFINNNRGNIKNPFFYAETRQLGKNGP